MKGPFKEKDRYFSSFCVPQFTHLTLLYISKVTPGTPWVKGVSGTLIISILKVKGLVSILF